jgi:hypothetical protein
LTIAARSGSAVKAAANGVSARTLPENKHERARTKGSLRDMAYSIPFERHERKELTWMHRMHRI